MRVVSMLWCPSILLTVSMGTPIERQRVAKLWRLMWKVIGYARKSREVKIKRKSFEMSDISVFCRVEKMQTATEY